MNKKAIITVTQTHFSHISSTQYQTTLNRIISFSGIGVHSNIDVSVTISPAPANTGIIFHRTDLSREVAIPAFVNNVVDTKLCTVIGSDEYGTKARVATIEHLMAALFGCGIDNALIQISGPEVPGMDGSAAPFVFLIEGVGKRLLDTPRKAIKITKEISVRDGNRIARITPAEEFSITCNIDFDHPLIGKQKVSYSASDDFKGELSRARTFCLESEVLKMRAAGLALGGSLSNAIVFSNNKVLNEGGLRFADEPARHKALDLIGDLALIGAPLIGHVETWCAGHSTNHQLTTKILDNKDSWNIVNAPEQEVRQDYPIAAAGGGA